MFLEESAMKRLSLVGVFLLTLFMSGSINNPCAAQFSRLYVFGDSYSDTGAGYVDGNGPTAVFYMARRMKIPLTHARDSSTIIKSLNFAVSGAQTGSGKGTIVEGALLGLGMMDQVEDFAARVRRKTVTFKPESTLFFIAGGLNDGNVATETTVRNLTDEIQILSDLGAIHITLALLPEKISAFSALSKRLNPAYEKLAATLAHELMADIRLNHWGGYFDDVITNPKQYGIQNTRDPCAGRAIFKEDTTPCGAPDTYFFYHAGHPSTAVHKIVGEKLFREISAWQGVPANN
jgi:phospholipase/lecithinase/hemolysin